MSRALLRTLLVATVMSALGASTAVAAPVTQQPLSDGGGARQGLFVTQGDVRPVDPGDTLRVAIRLRNTSSRVLQVTPRAIAGRGSDDVGSLVDVDPTAAKDVRRNPTSWVRFPFERLALRARSVATFDVIVRVPRDARPGARTVLLSFNVPTTEQGDGGVGVRGVGGAASTLVLQVQGQTTPSLRLSGVSGPRVVWNGETTRFRARVTNEGDTVLELDAQVQLHTFWGSSGRLLRADSQLVLPGGRRSYEIRYDDPPLFGRYAPRLTVVGGKGSDLRVSRDLPAVWVVPPWWFLAALLAAAALPLWLWLRAARDTARSAARASARTARARARIERRQEIAAAKRRAAEHRRRR